MTDWAIIISNISRLRHSGSLFFKFIFKTSKKKKKETEEIYTQSSKLHILNIYHYRMITSISDVF